MKYWNAKVIGGGSQGNRAMGNTCRRSEVKIHEERDSNIELAIDDLLNRSTCSYSIENDFSQASILAAVLLKFIIPP